MWQPYSEDVLASLPTYCTTGRDIWLSKTYLICWHIVEPHCPERVLRQFGFLQTIPPTVDKDEHAKTHGFTRQGKPNNNWRQIHNAYVEQWDDRRGSVLQDLTPLHQHVDTTEYMQWFLPQTVTYVEDPAMRSSNRQGFQGGASTLEYMVSFR